MRMPTTADLMSMWNASGLKEKLIFTFLMLVLFRFGIHLPVYGINNEIFSRIASGNNILGFLDLFSGSGAIGLEAISRGAKKAILCDKSKDAINIIKKNIEKTHLEQNVETPRYAGVIKYIGQKL